MENVPFMDDLPDKNRVVPYVSFSIALVKLPTGPVKITGPVGMISPQKTMERSTVRFLWVNIHYFDWAIFNSFL